MVTGHTLTLLLLFAFALAGFAQSLLRDAPFLALLFIVFAGFFLYEVIRELHYLLTIINKDDHEQTPDSK